MSLPPYFSALTPSEYLARLPVPLIEVHVHDNAGDQDSHSPLGSGNIPFEAVAQGLHGIGFDGVSTIEIAPSFHGSSPEESRPRAKDSLEQWRRRVDDARSGIP